MTKNLDNHLNNWESFNQNPEYEPHFRGDARAQTLVTTAEHLFKTFSISTFKPPPPQKKQIKGDVVAHYLGHRGEMVALEHRAAPARGPPYLLAALRSIRRCAII